VITRTQARVAERRRRALRRQWEADGIVASVWFAAALGISLNVAAGGLLVSSGTDVVREAGRLVGVVTAVLMMSQVLLASRAPWIDRAIGHDRAIVRHATLGKYAILLMFVHVALIVTATSRELSQGLVQAFFGLSSGNLWIAAVEIAAGLFVLVLVTSMFGAFRAWHYETWHTIHRIVYVAIAIAVPHQFLDGETFRRGGVAWLFWFTLYAVAFGSFVAFRMVRPLVLAANHRARVASVTTEADGSTTVVIGGRGLRGLGAKPGQFLLWRFYTPRLFWQKHPYSLSSAPRGDQVRISVKPSGRGSRAVADVRPGTAVTFEGPLGIFTHDARTRGGLVLIAAGIGITPIRALLEHVLPGEPCVVVVRVRSLDEAPLLDEVRALARDRSADLRILVGPRGDTWGSADEPSSIASLVRDPTDVDVFVCGPLAWARQVEADALESGVAPEAIHRERFGW
jgi:predicted ferric reductase